MRRMPPPTMPHRKKKTRAIPRDGGAWPLAYRRNFGDGGQLSRSAVPPWDPRHGGAAKGTAMRWDWPRHAVFVIIIDGPDDRRDDHPKKSQAGDKGTRRCRSKLS